MSVKLVSFPFCIYPTFRPFNYIVSIYGFSPESYPSIKHKLLSFTSSQEKNTSQLISPSEIHKEKETIMTQEYGILQQLQSLIEVTLK